MCLTIRYTITSITFKHVVDKLTVYKQYFQNGKKNLSEKKKRESGKKLPGNLGRIHGAYSEKLHSKGYEGVSAHIY